MDEQLVDLINRAIDGEASAEESARLRSTLASDPGAMEAHEAIRRMVLEIESIPQIEPPADLRGEILASIRARQERTRPPEASVARRVSFRRTPIIRYAWGIAAGIVLGFALHPFVMPPRAPLDDRQASGAMAPIAASSGAISRISKTVAASGVRATVTADVTKTTVAVGIQLDSGSAKPLELDWNPDRFAFDEIRRVVGEPKVSVRPGHAEIATNGPALLDLRLSRIGSDAPPVDLRSETPAASPSGALIEIAENP